MLNKKNAKTWNERSRYKVGDIVIFEGSYYINFSGINSSPENTGNWIYEGSVFPVSSNGGTYVEDIGEISVTNEVLTVETGVSGQISVYFDYTRYSLYESVDLSFTPVSEGKIKVLVVYALPDSQLIHLAEGVEGYETTEPDLPEGALFVRRGIITDDSVIFDPSELEGYKLKEEDNWNRVGVPLGSSFNLDHYDNKQNFFIYRGLNGGGSGATSIAFIKFQKPTNRALEFIIFNNIAASITINQSVTNGLFKGFTNTTPFVIKTKTAVLAKYNPETDSIDLIKYGADSLNVTNSSNTTTGSYTQTQANGHTWYWDSNGQEYGVKNLPSKINDAAFTDFVGKNSNGQFAKVGFPAFNSAFSALTVNEALILSQLLNGSAGSGGSINVNLISPPIIQNQFNTNEYVLLRGVGLDLSQTAMSIQILGSDQITVVATIPNNQIQLNSNGLELVFFYNFYNFPVGTYFIKITSGVKTYITTLDLKIVMYVENINLSSILWEKLYRPDLTPDVTDSAVGANFTMTSSVGDGSPIPSNSFKSSEIFAQGEDFYIEIKIDIGSKNWDSQWDYNKTFVGIGYSSQENVLSPSSLVNFNYSYSAAGNRIDFAANNSGILGSPTTPSTITCIIIKTGNLFRISVGEALISVTLSNNSGYSLFVQMPQRAAKNTLQGQIVKAFKFT